MTATLVADHSPHAPTRLTPLSTAANVVLIDNYDSFTWNVYQYLVLEGARVRVFRNDEVSLDGLIALKPTQLVVSPGPGHPDADAGISQDAIKHFAGRIPIFGVCMGQQCIISAFGGAVDVTGEIVHGKTSSLQHDGKGVYTKLPESLEITRYHSLAGVKTSLPDCLEMASWTHRADESGELIVMGVRHTKFTVEGVQFHPESILTEHGRTMFRNFLRLRSGTWQEEEALSRGEEGSTPLVSPLSTSVGKNKPSILTDIYEHRMQEVALQRATFSQRPADFQAAYDFGLSPPQISFTSRLRQSPFALALMAEIKRASPSKGIIAPNACAPAQARAYASAGASVISVLTEPKWFRGSIDDLRMVRQSLEGMPNRPAVLRKEFIFDEYQILEARLAGADSVLLIVKMLAQEKLEALYAYSRLLGMEPLVEVNTVEEMKIALDLGATVIGVNNRDLTSFNVDLGTTGRLIAEVPEGTVVCALSGISGPDDVHSFSQQGVHALLIGEALMRAKDTAKFIEFLMGGKKPGLSSQRFDESLLVKICGTRTPEAAKTAVEAGADLVGIILAEGRKRTVSDEVALKISRAVKETKRPSSSTVSSSTVSAIDYFTQTSASPVLRHPHRALLVGVFLNQPLSYVLQQQALLSLDVVQLHGDEPIEWANFIPVPVIRKFPPKQNGIYTRSYHALPLLDSGIGGTGEKLCNQEVISTLEQGGDGFGVLLAGGIDADNVVETINELGPYKKRIKGVDVSSGVESEGEQDPKKIKEFVKAAKGITL